MKLPRQIERQIFFFLGLFVMGGIWYLAVEWEKMDRQRMHDKFIEGFTVGIQSLTFVDDDSEDDPEDVD